MGFGRFGPGGCCSCVSEPPPPPEPPEPPVQWTTGDCIPVAYGGNYCGPCDPAILPPYPPSSYCSLTLEDDFSTHKRLPFIPYWLSLGNDNSTPLWRDHFYTATGKFLSANGLFYTPTAWPLLGPPGALYMQQGVASSLYLANLPKGCQAIPFWNPNAGPYQGENALSIQSPNNTTDVLPLKFRHRLRFNIDKEQLARWHARTWQAGQTANGEVVAFAVSEFGTYRTNSSRPMIMFAWGENTSNYGNTGVRLNITTQASVPAGLFSISDLRPFYNTPKITLILGIQSVNSYWETIVTWSDNLYAQWGENIVEFSVTHLKNPADNRTMFTTSEVSVNGAVAAQLTREIARPGYSQGGAPTDPQVEKMLFCTHQILARNHYYGVTTTTKQSGWYGTQTPRLSSWIDDWYADVRRP